MKRRPSGYRIALTRPILVFGAGGRVGQTLQSLTLNRSHPFAYCDKSGGVDITDVGTAELLIEDMQPCAIINLAACTLPYAEKPGAKEEASRVNCDAVGRLAALCEDQGIALVHLTTDCIWDGTKEGPYAEVWPNSPVNWYGETKWLGEECIRNYRPNHIIIRTTGVYLRDKPNFLETVLAKARAGETLECVSDSIYTPTDARELARAILTATERVIEDPSVSGTYHFAGPDVMSYLDFARLVQEEAGVAGEIRPVTMADREEVEGFKRPRNAALNSDKFAETFGLRHRPTRACVRDLVNPAS